MTLVIPTARLRLRLQSTESVLAWIESMSEADRAQVSPEWLARMRNAEPSAWTHAFELVDAVSGDVIGSCGFKGPPDADGVVEIAYEVHEDKRGRGLAKEAAAALTEFAVASGVRVVRAHTLTHNQASAGVLRACGFESVGEVVDPEDGPVWRWELRPGTRSTV
jgi:ribosomal-protein-alanine N-acetyltransferase